MTTRGQREEDLLKQMILLALAHDFMSPFRAMTLVFERLRDLLQQSSVGSAPAARIAEFCERVDEDVLPMLAGLYNEVNTRRRQPFVIVLKFLNETAGPRIDAVVKDARAIDRTLEYLLINGEVPRLRHELDLVLRKIKNMLTMLTGLRSVDRSSVGGQFSNLQDACRSAIGIARRTGARLEAQIWGAATVNANTGQIGSVFSNLISNAVKYSKQGQPAIVTVFIRRYPQERLIRVSRTIRERAIADRAPASDRYSDFERAAAEIREWIQVSIRDNGIGMPRRRIWGIFKPFKQLTAEDYDHSDLLNLATSARFADSSFESHYGFGLSLCQFFIRLHEGEIVVDSREGGPTTFAFWIPLGAGGQVKESVQDDGFLPWWEIAFRNRPTRRAIDY